MITGLLKENTIKQIYNMKTNLLKIIGSFFTIALAVTSLNAQTTPPSKYGATPEDSIECVKNQSLYAQHYGQKNYDLAVDYWRQNFRFCPASSENIYIRGQVMYEFFYEKTKDRAYIDTLVMIIDQRADNFGNRINMDIRKANLLAMNSGRYPDLLGQASDVFESYMTTGGDGLTAEAMLVYMKINSTLLATKKLSPEELMETYTSLMEVIEKKIKENPGDMNMADAKSQIENMLISSGVANCDNLVPLFTIKVAENPKDIEVLKRVIGFLESANCLESEVYYTALNNLFSIEKSANTAYKIAELSYKRNDLTKAEQFYIEAVSLETDPSAKSNYLTKLATLELSNKDYVKTRDYARQVLELTPSSGTAYFLIGTAYMSTKLGTDDFVNRTVFWVATDYFIKAKSVDPSRADMANESISVCAANYPKAEDAFFAGILIKEGESYTVGGWINERTTARYRQ